MEDDSEEIQSGGLLKRYVERPKCMKNVTLADWAAWYDGCGQKYACPFVAIFNIVFLFNLICIFLIYCPKRIQFSVKFNIHLI